MSKTEYSPEDAERMEYFLKTGQQAYPEISEKDAVARLNIYIKEQDKILRQQGKNK